MDKIILESRLDVGQYYVQGVLVFVISKYQNLMVSYPTRKVISTLWVLLVFRRNFVRLGRVIYSLQKLREINAWCWLLSRNIYLCKFHFVISSLCCAQLEINYTICFHEIFVNLRKKKVIREIILGIKTLSNGHLPSWTKSFQLSQWKSASSQSLEIDL